MDTIFTSILICILPINMYLFLWYTCECVYVCVSCASATACIWSETTYGSLFSSSTVWAQGLNGGHQA